jgi:hypothetical protein
MTRNIGGGASETVNASVSIHDSTVTVTIEANHSVEFEIIITDTQYNPVSQTGINQKKIAVASVPVSFTVDSGIYNIFILDKEMRLSRSLMYIKMWRGINDTLFDTLAQSGSIRGSVSIEQAVPIDVYLKGTPFSCTLANDYSFLLTDIPDGIYTIVAEMESEKSISFIPSKSIKREIVVTGDHITDLNLFFSK